MRRYLWALSAVAVLIGGEALMTMTQRRAITMPGSTGPWSAAVTAGDLVFVSSVRSSGGGDVAAQTRRALDRLRDVLTAAGSSLAQVATVHVFLRQAADFETMNGVYRTVFAVDPPTRTTVVSQLEDGVAVELSAVAVRNGALRETMHPAGWMKSPRPYSYIVRTKDFVFLSGLVSRRGTDDQAVGGPMETQVRTVLDNAGALLQAAGVSFADVVSSRVFITDASMFQAMNGEYRKYFASEPPARATVVTSLMGASAVEITLVASRTGKQVVVPGGGTTPLSGAVRAGGLVFLSGMLGNTAANATDVAAQTRETVARVRRALDTAGVSFADVVDHVVYLPTLTSRPDVDPILRELFPSASPAHTYVGARLVAPTGLVELMMTAVAR